MSIEGKVVGSAPGSADDQQGLQEEIERTREHLGQTVEALVAKVDVKARAQDEASRLIGRLRARVTQARRQAADKAAGPRQQATAQGRHVRRRVADKTAAPRQQAADAAAGIANATPEPVKQAAGTAAAAAGKHRKPLLVGVGAVAAALLGWLLINRWRRNG